MNRQTPDNPHADAHHDMSDSTMTFASINSLEEAFNVASASPEVRESVSGLPRGSALLVVQAGRSQGERFLLDADRIVAGRTEEADIFLNDVTVSRVHAEFLRQGAEFEVRDAGSLNGTYINRDRIDRYTLKNGDEIQIGKYRMIFYISPQSQGAPSPQQGQ
ncbi:FHA domain-containing protein [Jonesia quinghaiensis]|uniref:FHA domain-containing protein n=1 Tax=Jonesia quinghaiensis TaxID=262806 RepID=UPI0003F91062|nr:FHA domain-containing protein [Jonesia quinghaiensis]